MKVFVIPERQPVGPSVREAGGHHFQIDCPFRLFGIAFLRSPELAESQGIAIRNESCNFVRNRVSQSVSGSVWPVVAGSEKPLQRP